jgi:MYXO-CTERM domain-containing protein
MSNTLRPAHILNSSLLVAAALAASFGSVRTAQAQEKCGDTECPKGYTCETSTSGCPDIACLEGTDCKPCEPTEYSYCVAAECKTDADCGAHMKCAAIEQMDCAAPTAPATEPCAADTDCKVAPAPDEPADCTTTTIHQCQPQWTLPCNADADCGEGFACKEQESCWCSGSAGSVGGGSTGSAATGTAGSSSTSSGAGAAGGAAAGGAGSIGVPMPADDSYAPVAENGAASSGDVAEPPAPDESCGCEPTGEFACEAVETACSQDSDCPADWTCEDNPMGVCWADANGNSGCTPADPAKLCQPPYSDLGGGYVDARGEGTSDGTTGGDIAVDDTGSNSPEPPKAADGDASGSATSGDDTSHSSSDPGAPEDADGEQSAAPEADASSGETSIAGGGCSVSTGSGHAGQFGLMLAAAMAALGLRRRSAR